MYSDRPQSSISLRMWMRNASSLPGPKEITPLINDMQAIYRAKEIPTANAPRQSVGSMWQSYRAPRTRTYEEVDAAVVVVVFHAEAVDHNSEPPFPSRDLAKVVNGYTQGNSRRRRWALDSKRRHKLRLRGYGGERTVHDALVPGRHQTNGTQDFQHHGDDAGARRPQRQRDRRD